MLYPSIDSLMTKMDSKYILVTVASKRARQLQEKDDLFVKKPVSFKNVGKALEEIHNDFLTYEPEPNRQTDLYEVIEKTTK